MYPRFLLVDAIRGLAIAGVVLFHFVWDLEFTDFISGIAYQPLWLAFGRSLAGTFMLLVGVSLVLATRGPSRTMAYAIRLAKIIAAATAITVVTWHVFPETFIFFGILHAIAAATLIGTLFLRAPTGVGLLAAIVLLVAPRSGNPPLSIRGGWRGSALRHTIHAAMISCRSFLGSVSPSQAS